MKAQRADEERGRPMGVGAMMSSGEVPRTSKADDLWIRPADGADEWVNAAAPRNARGSSSHRVLADGIIVAPMLRMRRFAFRVIVSTNNADVPEI